MTCPTVEVTGRRIVLLSGYQRSKRIGSEAGKPKPIKIEARRKLRLSMAKNPDAVAFGYTAGSWVPAA